MKEDFASMTEDMIILKMQYKTMFIDKKKVLGSKKKKKGKGGVNEDLEESPIELQPPKLKVIEKDLDEVKKE